VFLDPNRRLEANDLKNGLSSLLNPENRPKGLEGGCFFDLFRPFGT